MVTCSSIPSWETPRTEEPDGLNSNNSFLSLNSIPLNGFITAYPLTPWKESYDHSRQHIEKQRHYFVNKDLSCQSYGFSSGHVWMWELDYQKSWMSKNWCFLTVVLRRLLRVPWTARKSNQSILKEISPGCSLEGLMLKLKLLYFGHLMQRVDSWTGRPSLLGFMGLQRVGHDWETEVNWYMYI